MINHYVNLVCWEEITDLYAVGRDKIFLDSVSIRWCVERFRKNVRYLPGSRFCSMLASSAYANREKFFFVAKPSPIISVSNQLVLPRFVEKRISTLPQGVEKVLLSIPEGAIVAIGISSPKQNWLASQMYERRPDLEYHCLGAALMSFGRNEDEWKNAVFPASGFEWIRFLSVSPSRTTAKLILTTKELFAIFCRGSTRRKFKRFIELCEPTSTNNHEGCL